MKRLIGILILIAVLNINSASGQCSICTKTTQQLGERPARALNAGILYLAFAPIVIAGFVGYRWWKTNREPE
jgi:hypothetical protein